MSSGLRIGWVSGAAPLIKRIILHQQTTVLHSSTLGQVSINVSCFSIFFDDSNLKVNFATQIQARN